MKPKISVIVPVRNREKLVERCLDSVLNQTFLPYELIVVDNNSEDSTYEVVKRWMKAHDNWPLIFKLLKEENKGACQARQKGLLNAKGDYLIFFDSDDEMLPSLIQRASEQIEKSQDTDIVCWKVRIKLLDNSYKEPTFMPSNPLEGHLIHALLRPQGMMVKKIFIEKSGGWAKPIKVWNDYELGLRLLLNNPKIVSIPEVLAMIYSQEDSITGKSFSSKQGLWEETLAEMDKVNLTESHPAQKKVKGILNYRRAILAAHYYREGNKRGASNLMRTALAQKCLKERMLLRFSYFFTSRGFRGAWRLVRFAY